MLFLRFISWVKGRKVGEDALGNRYFIERPLFKLPNGKQRRRWVVYKGVGEGSKVSPQWHGWLHFTTDDVPREGQGPKYTWEKPPCSNLSGTTWAYLPPFHTIVRKGKDKRHYKAWEQVD